MKKLTEILKESKTTNQQMRDYIKSWLRQDKQNYEATLDIILEAMMDYFKEEMDYFEDKSKVGSGKQSKEYNEAADLYIKIRDAYQSFNYE